MHPRTPTCVCCGDKFPGAHCKKCGFEPGHNRAPVAATAKPRNAWARHFAATSTAGGTPRITRKRRRHGVPVR
jgi:predicted amidophosphoribosyltransferase